MADTSQFTFRGPAQWEADLDALIPYLKASPYAEALAGGITRATALRVVVGEGLRVMQTRAGAQQQSEDLPSEAGEGEETS